MAPKKKVTASAGIIEKIAASAANAAVNHVKQYVPMTAEDGGRMIEQLTGDIVERITKFELSKEEGSKAYSCRNCGYRGKC